MFIQDVIPHNGEVLAQRSCGFPISGSVQGQPGQGLKAHPVLSPAMDRDSFHQSRLLHIVEEGNREWKCARREGFHHLGISRPKEATSPKSKKNLYFFLFSSGERQDTNLT